MTAATAAAGAPPRIWPRVLAGAAAIWLILDGVILLGTFPYWPTTSARWGLLLLAGPAAYLSLAGLFELTASMRRPARGRTATLALVALVALAGGLVALGAWWTLGVE